MKHLIALFLLLVYWPAFATNVTYSAPGSYSFTVPSGVTTIAVSVWGGGMSGNTDGGPGPGGSGGGFCFINIPVTPGGTVYIDVGAGGTNAGDEVVGFNSWVNNSANSQPTSSSHGCYAQGGGVTFTGNPFTQASCGVFGSVNHCGGLAVVATGGCNSTKYAGTGGSGGAGAAGDGVTAGAPPAPGAGGSGGGGQGGEGAPATACANPGVNGFAGFAPGGGGGGGTAGPPPASGGDGGPGRVVLFYIAGSSTGASQMFLTWPG